MSFKRFVRETRKKLPVSKLQLILLIVLLFGGLLTGIIIAETVTTFNTLKDIKPLETYSQYSVPTKVYDINNRLITEFFYQKREIISYKDLPDSLIKALVATEDPNFYTHRGFDLWAMIKGSMINPLIGRGLRGGSGVTQQLAKLLFTSGERSVTRKIKELWYAIQIEKKYSKEEILELYFNLIYYGHGCYGIESASNFFFDKHAKDLTVGEASFLAGLPQAPSRYSPYLNPYLAQKRHYKVLMSMVREGFITKAEAEDIYFDFWSNYDQTFKATAISANVNNSDIAPYFTEYVRQQMIDKYGEEMLYTGGLSIYTTLDIDKQAAAKEELVKGVNEAQADFDKTFNYWSKVVRTRSEDIVDLLSLYFGVDSITLGVSKIKAKIKEMAVGYNDVLYLSSFVFGLDDLNRTISSLYQLNNLVTAQREQVEGALVSIDPNTGYIEAMVGGSEFTYANQYNRAVLAKRPMGSNFKPFYYAIALDNHLITPATLLPDKPISVPLASGQLYTPRNYDGTFHGDVRVRYALQMSINVVAVQVWDMVLRKLGYTKMIATMSKFFGLSDDEMRNRVHPDIAYSLGVGVFTPLEVARAFSVFANGGHTVEPISILRVVDRYGRVVDDFEMQRNTSGREADQVISPAAAFVMEDMLNTVMYNGTGSRAANEAGYNYPGGGKTGTTPNWKDAWFSGFSKNLTTVVWIGFDDPTRSLGRGQAAAKIAAPIWMRYMKRAMAAQYPGSFSPPDGVYQASVCYDTGQSPTAFCPRVIPEYFLSGTAPNGTCTLHLTDTPNMEQFYQIHAITDVNVFREDRHQDNPYANFGDERGSDNDINLNFGD